jgi:hypothetical protein
MRRNQLLQEQRRRYFKELRILREQLFQKERLGEYYQPEDWGSYFDLDDGAAEAEGSKGRNKDVWRLPPLRKCAWD